MLRRRIVPALAVLVALGAACDPQPPGPGAAEWTPTVIEAVTTPGSVVHYPATATSTTWWAVVEQHSAVGPGATSTVVNLYRRSGYAGGPEATPAQTIEVALPFRGIAMSENVLAIRYLNGLAGLETTDLWSLDAGSGQWVKGGVVPFAVNNDRQLQMKVTDREIVYGSSFPTGASTGLVSIIPLTHTPGGVVADIFSPDVRAVHPDPSWSLTDRYGFGREVSIDGDTLAVSGGSDHVVVYRRSGLDWILDHTFTNPNAPATSGRFGQSIAVDESSGSPRLLLGEQGGFGIGGPVEPGRAVLYTRGGGGWTQTGVITPRPTNLLDGFTVGAEVTLDGPFASVGYHWSQLTPEGQPTIDDYRLEVWDVSSTPRFVTELSALAVTGGPKPGDTSAMLASPQQADTHITAVAWQNAGSAARYSAVTWDLR